MLTHRLSLMTFELNSQFHVYSPCLGTRWAYYLNCENASRHFQPGECPSRSLLRVCENFADGSFAALVCMLGTAAVAEEDDNKQCDPWPRAPHCTNTHYYKCSDIKLWTLILSLPIVTVAAWLPPRKADGVNIKHYNIGTIARTMAWAAHSPIILLMNMSGLDKSFLYILGLAAARSI